MDPSNLKEKVATVARADSQDVLALDIVGGRRDAVVGQKGELRAARQLILRPRVEPQHAACECRRHGRGTRKGEKGSNFMPLAHGHTILFLSLSLFKNKKHMHTHTHKRNTLLNDVILLPRARALGDFGAVEIHLVLDVKEEAVAGLVVAFLQSLQ